MLEHQRAGRIASAQAWRALIALPRHASAVEGALALQRLGRNSSEQDAVSQLLAHEYLSWQTTRVREKLDGLKRVAAEHRANVALVAARTAEIAALARFPNELYSTANLQPPLAETPSSTGELLKLAVAADWNAFDEKYADWRNAWEASLPNLLTPQEVERHGRLLVKLVRLVPKEYHNGVRDGQVVVPLEYREAKDFIVQGAAAGRRIERSVATVESRRI